MLIIYYYYQQPPLLQIVISSKRNYILRYFVFICHFKNLVSIHHKNLYKSLPPMGYYIFYYIIYECLFSLGTRLGEFTLQ